MTENAFQAEAPAPHSASPAQDVLLSDEQIRWLRRAVIIMTALLVAGIAVVIGRVIYLARPPVTQAATAASGQVLQPQLLPEVTLALPTGAQIKSITAAGSRLIVLHTSPDAGDMITILDLASGQTLSRVTIERAK